MPLTATLERQTGRLPAELTSFVGRKAELEQARRLIGDHRLVTLTGAGGVGKTRLAVRAAGLARDTFRDGVFFVCLSGLTEPSLLAQAICEALGVGERGDRHAAAPLADHLADLRVLLVLDTCEHLVDACATLSEALLRSAPELRVLATSRQPLDVMGEYTFTVPPPGGPRGARAPGADGAECDSVALFAERAAATVQGWALTGANRDTVGRLCARLDGIPLAIELAAVQLRAFSLEQVLGRRVLPGDRVRRPAQPARRGLPRRGPPVRERLLRRRRARRPGRPRGRGARGAVGPLLRMLGGGLSLWLAGDLDGALRRLRRSLRTKRDLGDRLGITLGLEAIAGCLCGGGDHVRAARLLGAADRMRESTRTSWFGPYHVVLRDMHIDETVEALGEARYRTAFEEGERLPLTRAIEEALEEPAPAPGGGDGADGAGACPLTAREREVALLVAEGLSNRGIAERLTIAKRTADSHVEHILAKLGYSSRTQIAVWISGRER